MDRGSKVSEDGCNGDRNALQQVCCSRRHLTAQARVQPLANACDLGKGFLRAGLFRSSAARIIPPTLHTRILFTYNRRYIITATNTQPAADHDNRKHLPPWPTCHGSSTWDVW
jgi:hypothetical protein